MTNTNLATNQTNTSKKGEVRMKGLRRQFIKLLNIHGVSSDETKVRNYLIPILGQMMDTVFVDNYGNLLAEKKCGSGRGATVMLSSHMDTVKGVQADRFLIEKDGVITSSKGALGADDRGGIAIILQVLKNIDKLMFEGTIKVAFSREEEIGCVGSSKIDSDWYSNVDLAIIVDRRGNRDIVTGCMQAFCSNAVGQFFEHVSQLQDMDWKAVEGGISDALTFSENGINSVNLSAGYYNEHTSNEYAVLSEMEDTTKLVLQAFAVINDFYHTFGEVPTENDWVKSYNTKYGSYDKYGYSSYYEDSWSNDSWKEDSWVSDYLYADEFDVNGDVYLWEQGQDVVIQQDNSETGITNEIKMSRKTLKSIFKQLNGKF